MSFLDNENTLGQEGDVLPNQGQVANGQDAVINIDAGNESAGDVGSLLVNKGYISEDQLIVAKRQLEQTGASHLGDVLVSMGFITESTLGEAISSTSGIDKFDIKSVVLDPELIRKIPKEIAFRYKVIPVEISEEKVKVAVHDVFDVIALDKVKRYFPPNLEIEPVYSSEVDILQCIDQYYEYEMSIDGILKEIEGSSQLYDANAAAAEDYKNPIVRLVDSLLIDAVHSGASDIHFEPEENFVRIRYRIDGSMQQIKAFHKDYWSPVAVRVKIMSGMNIAESRKPQDGHATAHILGREVDFRVASQPTVSGENIVMRILDKTKSLVGLDQLGYSKHNIDLLKKLLKKPEGMIILTGPTGSGKTTTLYSILSYINSVSKNIMTLEDPVEYELPLIRQTSIKEGNVGFADGMRAVLRQDPDVIFVGEIRDNETAKIALQSAMTGHQVFTTLHTNDSTSVIARLVDVGLEPFLLSGSLICCVAQRLIRKLCEHCKEERDPTEEERKILKIEDGQAIKVFDKKGCPKCFHSGFRGRIAISEIFSVTRKIDEMIALGATNNALREEALKSGFVSMVHDGVDKVLSGITTVAELESAVDITERM